MTHKAFNDSEKSDGLCIRHVTSGRRFSSLRVISRGACDGLITLFKKGPAAPLGSLSRGFFGSGGLVQPRWFQKESKRGFGPSRAIEPQDPFSVFAFILSAPLVRI